ncbi:hypothetical protein [Pollutibacter soli]|uniref:hypothetical protein n=1 Tax=Pollutibacter soli TaxID=3034157 RepID=UPI0030132751
MIITVTIHVSKLGAQEKNWQYRGQFNFGCQIFLYSFFKSNNFPGFRVYVGFNASAIKGDVIANYGGSVSVYHKTVGASLNPLVRDFQIDFTNSISAGFLWGSELPYMKLMRTVQNGDFYNLSINRRGAFLLGTNLILNNHNRHQMVASVNLNVDKFSLNYYNDGGPPWDWIPLADKFDRYWTGGICLFFHTEENYNAVEFGFDQFTGYKPLLYELSNLVGIKVPLYDGEIKPDSTRQRPPNYNTASYHLRVNFDRNIGLNIGITGAMVDDNGKFWGLQDIIHTRIKNSLHPNNDPTRLYLGGTYNNIRDVRF